jgi:RecA-family ATPase
MPINILSALSEKPENLDFVLPGLVAGTVGAIVSPGGSGKSALALQIAAQMAGGPDLLGIGNTAQAMAAYLPGEDPELAVRHRLFALGEQCSPEHREAMSKRLYIEPLESMTVNLMSPEWFEYFMQIANHRRLLVIDTLRIIHQMDENDSGAMTQLVGQMKIIAAKTRCAIVFLHHTSKSSAMNDQGAEQQASRGSSVLVDNIRWQGYLRTMSEKDAKLFGVEENQRRHFVEFGVSKQNYGAPFAPVWLRKVSCTDKEIAGGYTLQKAHLQKKASNKNNNTAGVKNEFVD